MVSELLKRAEERRDGTEKDCLGFWWMGMKGSGIQLFPLYGRLARWRVETKQEIAVNETSVADL